MSRVGKKPVSISDVEIKVEGQVIKVKGKLGELSTEVHPNMNVSVNEGELVVERPDDTRENKALHGLTRALIQNMVTGVTEGFSKTLEVIGVGYRVEMKDKNLLLNLGYSHPIYFVPPDEIKIELPANNQIKVSGVDKELVGLVASKIRSFKKPEPYKGKGIKYSDEVIVRKAGKAAGK
ncbi:MAG: 50S ribosomal protein L6 [Melioribacteraceae bacterium]|nr:MAG: 50S ribosomal protein L6 [Melioribacteraceae bacterium]